MNLAVLIIDNRSLNSPDPSVRTTFALITVLIHLVSACAPSAASRSRGQASGRPPEASASAWPAGRDSHLLISAGARGGVFLLGGNTSSGPQLRDTLWQWTGNAWRVASVGGPNARLLGAAAFDTRRERLVLHGGAGRGSGTLFGDTWEWDGDGWKELDVATPGARDHHAMVYDPDHGRVLIYGGAGRGDASPIGMWAWDGTSWDKVDTTAGPGARFHHAMAFDTRRKRLVLFGGLIPGVRTPSSETWEWDGSRWERRVVRGPVPAPRSHHRMAFDAARGVTVLFGGSAGSQMFNDTWSWNGETWTQQAGESPAPRALHAMAYDMRRERVMLFGGILRWGGARSAELWEWDGRIWRSRGPA